MTELSLHMKREWEAWQAFHEGFTKLTGIDINEERCNQFVELTRAWAESLALLRIEQGSLGEEYARKGSSK